VVCVECRLDPLYFLNFIIATIPVAPVATAPTGSGIPPTVAFTFTGVANATQYTISLSDYTTATGSQISFTSAQAGCAVGTACSYTPVTPLTAGHSYGWNVSGSNAIGQGLWSNVLNFIVPLNAPVATAPTGPGVSTTAAFTFTGVAGATQYTISLSDYTTATGSQISFTSAQAGCAVGTACSYTPVTPLKSGHGYGWNVSASNATTGMGLWSNVLNLIVQ
jgi:hypothetical protein